MKSNSKVLGLCVAILLCTSIAVPFASGQTLPQPETMVSDGARVYCGRRESGLQDHLQHEEYALSDLLANSYGLATNYLLVLASLNRKLLQHGLGPDFYPDNDSATPSSLKLTDNNIAYEVQQAGKTWKDYVENLPAVSGCKGYHSGTYYVRHDPLEYYTNINTQKANYVCWSQFATDLANKALPNLSWLVPNGYDDAHDSTATAFDNWLKAEIAPLLASSYFQAGGDGLLIVTWDENATDGTPDCQTTTEEKVAADRLKPS